jgi:hypothetical protein
VLKYDYLNLSSNEKNVPELLALFMQVITTNSCLKLVMHANTTFQSIKFHVICEVIKIMAKELCEKKVQFLLFSWKFVSAILNPSIQLIFLHV